jgi:hypothetical protein
MANKKRYLMIMALAFLISFLMAETASQVYIFERDTCPYDAYCLNAIRITNETLNLDIHSVNDSNDPVNDTFILKVDS